MDLADSLFPRVRAFRCEESEAQVRRQMSRLSLFCQGPACLARALREVRKAANAGRPGYDPARHAALLRLSRVKPRDSGAGGMR